MSDDNDTARTSDENNPPVIANLTSGLGEVDPNRHRQPLYPEHWCPR